MWSDIVTNPVICKREKDRAIREEDGHQIFAKFANLELHFVISRKTFSEPTFRGKQNEWCTLYDFNQRFKSFDILGLSETGV